ncbi:Hypothetical protein D9617_12g037520 [Elsinoe fawcettii]|nr:Hypothetical protein D9617_12g037520 [Elsinoe fawcettii]
MILPASSQRLLPLLLLLSNVVRGNHQPDAINHLAAIDEDPATPNVTDHSTELEKRQLGARIAYDLGAGAIGAAGWWSSNGWEHHARIKGDCHGFLYMWSSPPHNGVNTPNIHGVPCHIYATKILIDHTLAFLAGGGLREVGALIQGTGSSQKVSTPDDKNELKRDLNATASTDLRTRMEDAYFNSDLDLESLVPWASMNQTLINMEQAPKDNDDGEVMSLMNTCGVHGLSFNAGWFSYWGSSGVKVFCKAGCEVRHWDSYYLKHVSQGIAEHLAGVGAMNSQFTLWNKVSRRVIARCGVVAQMYGAGVCPEWLDGDTCGIPGEWR